MRHVLATASMLVLLAAAPAARAQMNGPPGQNMGPGPNGMPDSGMMGNPNMYGPGGASGPGMMGQGPMGQGPMGPGTMGPGPMSGQGGMGGGMGGPNMMGQRGMAGPNGMFEHRRAMRQAVNDQDRRFVEEAASAGLMEVQAGHLAMQRGEAPAVRELGRWMVTDHTEMGNMLDHHAERAGLSAPSQLNAKDRDSLERLKRHTGAEFDMHYLMDQVEAHKQAVELFKEEAESGQSPPLRWFARHMEPMLTQHLAEAQELRAAPESAAAHAAHASTPAAPMAEAVKPPRTLQEGTTPAVRHSLNQEGAQRIEKEGK